ncbi:hypothetical protein OVY01_17915 [Robbsia sp. Bb-Pol-6]|uniref:Uncharacterized protein n=1 Tax=Robbsia betulipollinis TaxID=2981849 RepID=A0ABT3ZRI9_9BURK|nr:hypothetical protein [Robbsia betulipollinis]MCY0389032.1 hypothetical protein [Robbsia betulipollinis]
MKKIALLFIGGLIVSSAFQQGYAEASKREAPVLQMGYQAGSMPAGWAGR